MMLGAGALITALVGAASNRKRTTANTVEVARLRSQLQRVLAAVGRMSASARADFYRQIDDEVLEEIAQDSRRGGRR
jgi:hypothetical protein